MRFHCHRPSLAAAFGLVGGVIPSRTPKEILQNVRLSVQDDTLSLSATDSEIGIVYTISGVEADHSGDVLLPQGRVSSILRELTHDQVTFDLTDDQITISSGQSEFRLSSEDPAEFPVIAGAEEEGYFEIPAKVLREAIRRTVFAADTESTRYALGGVLVDPGEQGGVTFAATDSRRLAVCEVHCQSQGDPGGVAGTGAVVPSKAFNLLERILAGLDDEDTARLTFRQNDVVIKSGPATIISRLVEGRFPKYRQVIPAESPIEIPMVAGEFHTAIKQSQILTTEEHRGVDFAFAEGTLTLQSQAAIGASKIAIPIDYSGEPLEITFDPKYVGEVLRVLDPTTSFLMYLTDSDTQIVMRVGTGYTYVVMPLSRDRTR